MSRVLLVLVLWVAGLRGTLLSSAVQAMYFQTSLQFAGWPYGRQETQEGAAAAARQGQQAKAAAPAPAYGKGRHALP